MPRGEVRLISLVAVFWLDFTALTASVSPRPLTDRSQIPSSRTRSEISSAGSRPLRPPDPLPPLLPSQQTSSRARAARSHFQKRILAGARCALSARPSLAPRTVRSGSASSGTSRLARTTEREPRQRRLVILCAASLISLPCPQSRREALLPDGRAAGKFRPAGQGHGRRLSRARSLCRRRRRRRHGDVVGAPHMHSARLVSKPNRRPSSLGPFPPSLAGR